LNLRCLPMKGTVLQTVATQPTVASDPISFPTCFPLWDRFYYNSLTELPAANVWVRIPTKPIITDVPRLVILSICITIRNVLSPTDVPISLILSIPLAPCTVAVHKNWLPIRSAHILNSLLKFKT